MTNKESMLKHSMTSGGYSNKWNQLKKKMNESYQKDYKNLHLIILNTISE